VELVVDASILVAELLRERGRDLLAHPALRPSIAEPTWGEGRHELERRVAVMRQQGRLSYSAAAVLLETGFRTVARRVELVPAELYAYREAEARRRIPRDPVDWPTVALALALDAAI
jgi:hypothetical protein